MKLRNKLMMLAILPIGLVIFSIALLGQRLYQSHLAIERYVEIQTNKQEIITSILRYWGYGHGIHHFKNYVLRGDDWYRSQALLDLAKVEDLIDQYMAYEELSLEEKQAMIVLRSTVSAYKENISLAQKALEESRSIRKIDLLVKIDDGPAIESFKMFNDYFRKTKQDALQNYLDAKNDFLSTSIITIVLILGVTFYTSRWFSRSMIKSFNELVQICRQIKSGRFRAKDLEAPTAETTTDEIKYLRHNFIAMGRALEESFSRLKKSNQDLSNFAYIASHDLKEPIKKIANSSDLLYLELERNLDSESKQYFDVIQSSTKHMLSLLDNVLDYSELRSQKFEPENVDLNEAISLCQSDLELAIQSTGAHIELENLPRVKGNPVLLRTMFRNLLSNALQFRRKGSIPKITISAKPTKQGRWVISVEDNGIGFSMKYRDKILKPFGRAHSREQAPGNGIGLASSQRIAELHHSQLQVYSMEGVGSTFSVELEEAS
ncbi:sensor histidine kinase [Pseudobacteriovorax antillogorgiicola]|uniref:histidine kinase n=1 Tax=Pseudobacteriovorax antillogorgiicola TaxID=1513793 RepID=A0A1Y6CIJ5_9BACT|nr:ATP-binding protein [Pseudobacteriovorax antillogorgiicola]TCS46936.1 HAMP domain-containing protein [Pseudobacteriovorax antillogorgiicola]SMF64358.1 HAMP domain-containing protein [Pseudobacteriovorax antillogorgiicola]